MSSRAPTDDRSFELRRTAMPGGGYVLTVTDTTERVRADAAARDAQRLQAMGQLTGGIAHDFNNLLTVVLGNLEMANAMLEANSPVLARLDRAIWAAHRGASLTQQLLAFARKQPLAPMPINLSTLLPDMADLLQRTLGEHIEVAGRGRGGAMDRHGRPGAGGERAAEPRAERPRCHARRRASDDRGCQQGAGSTSTPRRHAEVAPGDYVMLAVSDTGTGMPREVLARVFEPFFTTKEPGKGTGLGLAMVFGFAKQSGGHVNIYSEPGKGTTVRLTCRAPSASSCRRHRAAAVPVELPRGSATILVVEDDDDVREVAVAMLRDLGYRVLAAADGAEALRVFGENDAKVDLLLVDVVLPGGMKGDEVARRLGEARPGVRVLFMSGYTENPIVHHDRLDDSAAAHRQAVPAAAARAQGGRDARRRACRRRISRSPRTQRIEHRRHEVRQHAGRSAPSRASCAEPRVMVGFTLQSPSPPSRRSEYAAVPARAAIRVHAARGDDRVRHRGTRARCAVRRPA